MMQELLLFFGLHCLQVHHLLLKLKLLHLIILTQLLAFQLHPHYFSLQSLYLTLRNYQGFLSFLKFTLQMMCLLSICGSRFVRGSSQMLIFIHEVHELHTQVVRFDPFLIEVLLQIQIVLPQCHKLNLQFLLIIQSLFELVLQLLNCLCSPFLLQVHLEHVVFSMQQFS